MGRGIPKWMLGPEVGLIPCSAPSQGRFRSCPRGRVVLTQVHTPPVILVLFAQKAWRARRGQRPSVSRTKKKGPAGPRPLPKPGCNPSGLPPWKPPPTLTNCPRGCRAASHRQDNRPGSGTRSLRWVPVPALPRALGTLPVDGRWGGGHGRTRERKHLESSLTEESAGPSRWLCWNISTATGHMPECSKDRAAGYGSEFPTPGLVCY